MTKRLDPGLIDRGSRTFVSLVCPAGAGPVQRSEMRKSFKAGAAFLFHSIFKLLDEGTEPTAEDLEKMDIISREIDAIGRQVDFDFIESRRKA